MLEALVPHLIDHVLFEGRQVFFHFARPEKQDNLQMIQLGAMYPEPGYDYGPSVRDHELVHFVLSGSGCVTVCGRCFQVRAGELFYIPRDCAAYYQGDENDPWVYVWLGFDGDWADRVLEETNLDKRNLVASIADVPEVNRLRARLCAIDSIDNGSYMNLMPLFWQLINALLKVRGREPESIAQYGRQEKPTDSSRVADLIRRLDTGYMRDVSVSALAEEMGVSRGYLSRIFRAATGRSIIDYVTDMRIDRAKTHLALYPTKPIAEIAASNGYPDPLFFSRVFRKKTGMSPRQWRTSALRREQDQPQDRASDDDSAQWD